MYEDFEPVDLSIPYQVRSCPSSARFRLAYYVCCCLRTVLRTSRTPYIVPTRIVRYPLPGGIPGLPGGGRVRQAADTCTGHAVQSPGGKTTVHLCRVQDLDNVCLSYPVRNVRGSLHSAAVEGKPFRWWDSSSGFKAPDWAGLLATVAPADAIMSEAAPGASHAQRSVLLLTVHQVMAAPNPLQQKACSCKLATTPSQVAAQATALCLTRHLPGLLLLLSQVSAESTAARCPLLSGPAGRRLRRAAPAWLRQRLPRKQSPHAPGTSGCDV